MFKKIIHFSYEKPKILILIVAMLSIAAILQFPRIKIDTDPENMLREDEFVRVFHHEVKKEFALYDFVILGVVNEKHPQGVFNVETLGKIHQLTEKAKSIPGVIKREIIAPSTKDNIRQGGIGEVIFEWLMKEPPKTQEAALRIKEEALDNPLFKGTMVSEDGMALCLYIPIERKDMSYRISQELKAQISDFQGDEKYYITGLPVAEDTFGVQMFKQMAISAPLAGLIIFLLMLWFFKSISMIISPMILAIVTVLVTMGLLIGLGFPVHIMSSMIPIFLMPIAVLDSVHILSEFFDKYHVYRNKKDTIFHVLDELFTPMLFTSLTSAVGFFSLSFSPIPPVQTFGVFVAIGIMTAWIMTITFIPAYISLLSDKSLKNFGHKPDEKTGAHNTIMDKALRAISKATFKYAKPILLVTLLVTGLSIYGISRIKINDNPVKWFTENHPIRIADKVLNEHFGGTYTAYLVLEAQEKDKEVFKEPEMLNYVERLQAYLKRKGDVGKSTTLVDVVKKVYYELLGGDKKDEVIPESKRAVSQTLISFQNSHKPDDLWHFVTPDYTKLNIWLQLKSGDNQDMQKVYDQVDAFIKENKPPFNVKRQWAGLTYINLVWQNKMVGGMLQNFLASFIIVFFMMTFLFRSPIRGLISMIPLTVTILFIYSLLGFIGKQYDMPVAVLSALTLGLSIDFAIHFIQRAREINHQKQSWQDTSQEMFGGPARAITRNALVIAIGFLPLLAAPLVPYKTVGFFMFAIMLVSSIATLIILPAIISLFQQAVFKEEQGKIVCNCRYCVIISLGVSVAVLYFLLGYTKINLTPSIFISLGFIGLFGGICSKISNRQFCLSDKTKE